MATGMRLRTLTSGWRRAGATLLGRQAQQARCMSSQVSSEQLENQYIAKTYTSTGVRTKKGLTISHGKGAYVYDTNGRKYLDFASGIAVNILGHGNEKWVQAITEQASAISHVSNLFFSEPYLRLAKMLVDASKFDKVFFCNSGTEANEAALKFSRLFAWHKLQGSNKGQKYKCVEDESHPCSTKGGRCECWATKSEKTRFIAFQHGFHGRSMGSLSLTHKPAIREPFAPLLQDVTFLPYDDLEAFKANIDDDVCAVFVEPIQGEGGVFPASLEFIKGLRELTKKHDALLVCDEVQCGLGRAGRMWAHEAYDIVPDIMTLAKPLAGGLPIGAVLMTDEVANAVHPGSHGTTFGGSPVCCRAGEVVMEAILEPSFLKEVNKNGKTLISKLEALKTKYPEHIASVRSPIGKAALFAGVELTFSAGDVVTKAIDQGVLFITAGEKILRLAPPLVVNEHDVNVAVDVLESIISNVAPPS